jgi:hypothetical protein
MAGMTHFSMIRSTPTGNISVQTRHFRGDQFRIHRDFFFSENVLYNGGCQQVRKIKKPDKASRMIILRPSY